MNMPLTPDWMEQVPQPRPPWNHPPMRNLWTCTKCGENYDMWVEECVHCEIERSKPVEGDYRDECGCRTKYPHRAGGSGVMTIKPRTVGEGE